MVIGGDDRAWKTVDKRRPIFLQTQGNGMGCCLGMLVVIGGRVLALVRFGGDVAWAGGAKRSDGGGVDDFGDV